MKKTIKIIDLLKMQANGEKLPKKIRFHGDVWELKYFHVFNDDDKYFDYMTWHGSHLFYNKWLLLECLNENVEIIEEDKEIEKLENPTLAQYLHTTGEDLYYQDMKIYNKINELIDEVNELKKGNKK